MLSKEHQLRVHGQFLIIKFQIFLWKVTNKITKKSVASVQSL